MALLIISQSLCGSFHDVVAFYPVCELTGVEEAKYVSKVWGIRCRSEPGQSCLHFLSLFANFCLVSVVSLL